MTQSSPNNKQAKEEYETGANSFSIILHNFAGETTAHGFAQLINAKWLLLKFVWVVGITTCYIFIFLHVKKLIVRYGNKPITTNVFVVTEHTPFFPVIALCNRNMIRKDKATELVEEIKKINNESDKNIVEDTLHSSIAQLAQIIHHKIYEYGEQFEDLIQECKLFKVHSCKSRELWNRIWLPYYGTCFVYNDIHNKNGKPKPIEKVSGASRYDALKLELNISQSQYSKDTGAGVRIFIGEQGSFYKPHENGFSLSSGFSYDVLLSKSKNIRADPFKNQSCMPKSNLSFYNLGEAFHTKYDVKSCHLKCYSEEMEKTCKCIRYDLPEIHNRSRICDHTEHSCYEKVKEKYVTGKIECLKLCHPPCQEVSYETDISLLKYPNTESAKKYNKPIAKLREEILQVYIYFKTLNVRITKENTMYEIEDLLADIGGQLGLFSGYSVLTVIELICLLFTIVAYFSRKAGKLGKVGNSRDMTLT